MGRVAWTRLSGDEVEEVVAILVSREHPRAERIRPSQGDGGIDVLLPLDGGTFQVLQVKKFAENLTASQKTQIEKSFNRLVSYAKSRGMRVSGWSLVTPLDRTKENLEWLESVTKAADFDIEWRGLPYVEGLVSKYPEVIDYYLHDGKDRLEAAVSSLSSLLRFHASRDATPGNYQVADSMATLHTLHAEINRYDPHYRYDVSVESDTTEASQPDIPGLVCTVQQSDGRSRVTVKVIARFSDAVHVRPIPLSVMIRAEQGSELETALEEFGAFGTPVTVPLRTSNFRWTSLVVLACQIHRVNFQFSCRGLTRLSLCNFPSWIRRASCWRIRKSSSILLPVARLVQKYTEAKRVAYSTSCYAWYFPTSYRILISM